VLLGVVGRRRLIPKRFFSSSFMEILSVAKTPVSFRVTIRHSYHFISRARPAASCPSATPPGSVLPVVRKNYRRDLKWLNCEHFAGRRAKAQDSR
jgi:hypothetical protein